MFKRVRRQAKTVGHVARASEIVMDHLAIVEALRRAQAKVAFYLEPGRDHHQGLREISAILEEEQLRLALEQKSKAALVPGDHAEEVAPAAPLSR
jgi:hypothetical protein